MIMVSAWSAVGNFVVSKVRCLHGVKCVWSTWYEGCMYGLHCVKPIRPTWCEVCLVYVVFGLYGVKCIFDLHGVKCVHCTVSMV